MVVETSIRRSVCATVQTMDAQLGLRMNLLSFGISSLSIFFKSFSWLCPSKMEGESVAYRLSSSWRTLWKRFGSSTIWISNLYRVTILIWFVAPALEGILSYRQSYKVLSRWNWQHHRPYARASSYACHWMYRCLRYHERIFRQRRTTKLVALGDNDLKGSILDVQYWSS